MSYNLGDYVQLSKKRKGHIRYEGTIPVFGDCYGVELDVKDSQGNDGSFDNKKYFDVKPGFGAFIKKSRIVSLIKAKDKGSKPPKPIATTETVKNGSTSSSTSSPSKKSKKKSTKTKGSKSPKKGSKSPNTPTSSKYRRDNTNKKKRSSTPRPRASTRDPRSMSLKKPTSSSSSSTNLTKAKYPIDGTNKQKLMYIFNELSSSSTSSSKKANHKKTTSEISKNKIDLIKKASLIIGDLENQDTESIENLITPNYIIKEFKKIFGPSLKDKKFVVHREILQLFNSLLLCKFTRQGMAEQTIFFMKHLTNQLTHSNTKTVNATKRSIQILINEILLQDNTKLIKLIMNELLRYCKTSKKKIIRKNCWLFIVQILENKYNVKRPPTRPTTPISNHNKPKKEADDEKKEEKVEEDEDSPPVPSEIEELKEKEQENDTESRVIKKKNKPPKSIMDSISNGLKQGLNDKDKDVQIQAMRVLSLFSLLEETKADRLISKMSTSTRRLFDSKYGSKEKNGKKNKQISKSLSSKSLSSKNVTSKNGKNGKPKKKPSTKTTKKRDSGGKKLFSLKEDPAPNDKKGKNSKTPKKDTKGKKKISTKDKGGKNGKTKGSKKDGSKSPKKKSVKTKGDKKSTKGKKKEEQSDNGVTKDGNKSPKKKKEVTPSEDTNNNKNDNNDDNDDDNKAEYTLNDDEEDAENAVNINEVRKRRRQIRGGQKKRSHGTFDGGNNVGSFDLTALSSIMNGGGGGDSGSDEDDDNDNDNDEEGDGDKNKNKNNDNEAETVANGEGAGGENSGNNKIQMNAGMNGDVRKDGDEDDPYSSSTETYEGDNDIDIYEFPRKDALNKDSVKDGTDLDIDIDRYLANNNPEYNWKFGNEEMIFFSLKQNTHELMSRISQIKKNVTDNEVDKDIDYSNEQMTWIEKLLSHEIDYDNLSLISDTNEFWPTDIDENYQQLLNPSNGNNNNNGIINGAHNTDDDIFSDNDTADNNNNNGTTKRERHEQHDFIVATQISYNLMRLLTNEHGSDWIKQFIEECIYEITIHALCVFHPLSNGNVYHGRVILEVLLNHFPRDFFKYLVEDSKIIQPLLRYAVFNKIHHGNLNSFVMDLICFDPESIQQRDDIMFHEKSKMVQETAEYKTTLLNTIFCDKWKFIENIMKRGCSKHCDDVSTKYSVFFVDLVARCASIETTKCLFNNQQDLIIDSFVNGLLGKDSGKELNFWQRIRCGQSLVEYLDLASRPTIMDPSIAQSPFGFMNAQNAYKENIFFPTFKYCLSRLIHFIPQLCMLIIDGGESDCSPHKLVKLSYGDINKPLGRLKLTALELLTVTIDFHEMNCALVLKQIPDEFWNKIIDMAFLHKYNNMFLCHFRRLVHLAMIFRRRILKHLCEECKMIDRMIDFYERETQRSELHGYILQMINDIYRHDSDIKHIQQQ